MKEQEQRLKEQQAEEQRAAHAEWLMHPVTQQLLKRLSEHENNLINAAVNGAESQKITENFFQMKMVAIRTVRAAQMLVTTSNTSLLNSIVNS